MEIEITEKNIDKVLEGQTVLIDFWAVWCGPCRMIAPEVEKIAENYSGKIAVGKVNVDECEGLAEKFGIEVIPTLVLMKNGKEVKRNSGVMSYNEIENFIK